MGVAHLWPTSVRLGRETLFREGLEREERADAIEILASNILAFSIGVKTIRTSEP
jgi:hypothetical protein